MASFFLVEEERYINGFSHFTGGSNILGYGWLARWLQSDGGKGKTSQRNVNRELPIQMSLKSTCFWFQERPKQNKIHLSSSDMDSSTRMSQYFPWTFSINYKRLRGEAFSPFSTPTKHLPNIPTPPSMSITFHSPNAPKAPNAPLGQNQPLAIKRLMHCHKNGNPENKHTVLLNKYIIFIQYHEPANCFHCFTQIVGCVFLSDSMFGVCLSVFPLRKKIWRWKSCPRFTT